MDGQTDTADRGQGPAAGTCQPSRPPPPHVPRLTEANAFPRASPELPAVVPREPGGVKRAETELRDRTSPGPGPSSDAGAPAA